MIIDIAHIGFSTTSLFQEKHKDILLEKGYSLRFQESDLTNPLIKEKLLSSYSPKHFLAVFDRKNSISIELINNYSVNNFVGAWNLFSFKSEDVFESITDIEIIKSLETINNKHSFIFGYCVSISDTEIMWNLLGFITISSSQDHLLLKIITFVGQIKYVAYMRSESVRKSFLDDVNFSFVALVSSSAKKDWAKMKNKNYTVTNLELLEVNGRSLELFFLTGHSGEQIEIFSLK